MQNKEIIPVEQTELGLAIDSRLLHKKLNIATPHQIWIKRRIKECGFEGNNDFCTNLYKSTGGRRAVEYIITLDVAKELAMMEFNAVGRAIRRYFIEIEKRYRDWIGFILPKLERDFDLFGSQEGYHYEQLLNSCRLSTNKQAMMSRVRRNKHQFWRNQKGVLFVSEKYGKTIITNAIARKLNQEAKESRLLNEKPKDKQLAQLEKLGD